MKKNRLKIKLSLVTIELIVVGVLLATIIITNIALPQSGINKLINGTFSTDNNSQVLEIDEREYSDFSAIIPVKDVSKITLDNGVMSFSYSGSIYTPCDGVVKSVIKLDDNSYQVEITHNDNFSSCITGLKYCYFSQGEKVFTNIPIGYIDKDLVSTVSLFNKDGESITNYSIENGKLNWAV